MPTRTTNTVFRPIWYIRGMYLGPQENAGLASQVSIHRSLEQQILLYLILRPSCRSRTSCRAQHAKQDKGLCQPSSTLCSINTGWSLAKCVMAEMICQPVQGISLHSLPGALHHSGGSKPPTKAEASFRNSRRKGKQTNAERTQISNILASPGVPEAFSLAIRILAFRPPM